MTKTEKEVLEDYKKACQQLENRTLEQSAEISNLKTELRDLRMKVGHWRCFIRQRPLSHDVLRAWILETPETWEPNVKF